MLGEISWNDYVMRYSANVNLVSCEPEGPEGPEQDDDPSMQSCAKSKTTIFF